MTLNLIDSPPFNTYHAAKICHKGCFLDRLVAPQYRRSFEICRKMRRNIELENGSINRDLIEFVRLDRLIGRN